MLSKPNIRQESRTAIYSTPRISKKMKTNWCTCLSIWREWFRWTEAPRTITTRDKSFKCSKISIMHPITITFSLGGEYFCAITFLKGSNRWRINNLQAWRMQSFKANWIMWVSPKPFLFFWKILTLMKQFLNFIRQLLSVTKYLLSVSPVTLKTYCANA